MFLCQKGLERPDRPYREPMFPWEHAVVGYIAYSLICHLVFRDSPSARESLLVLFGSLLPDLVDKPLAWQFGVFEGGYAIGHSIFFAVPISILVGLLAHRYGARRAGLAFVLGYLLHLPGDLISPYVERGDLEVEKLLWPIEQAGGTYSGGLIGGFLENFLPYLSELLSLELSIYSFLHLGLMGCAFLLWIYDGMPILREATTEIRRVYVKKPGH